MHITDVYVLHIWSIILIAFSVTIIFYVCLSILTYHLGTLGHGGDGYTRVDTGKGCGGGGGGGGYYGGGGGVEIAGNASSIHVHQYFLFLLYNSLLIVMLVVIK